MNTFEIEWTNSLGLLPGANRCAVIVDARLVDSGDSQNQGSDETEDGTTG